MKIICVLSDLHVCRLSALSSLDDDSGPAVSIQTELALEQLKQKHKQELQQLHIQLDTQVTHGCLLFVVWLSIS